MLMSFKFGCENHYAAPEEQIEQLGSVLLYNHFAPQEQLSI